ADELLKNLLENGFPKTSAKQCLSNCGFSETVVENALKNSGSSAPHPLVRRIAALEEKLRRKKK
ncbi:hypothetical protein HY571_02855, partial [Candidatus Micrarchaeota archaeon]|nr:hypothetical protein [Candidatus Micrarchaeota archaeon]